MRWGLVVLVCVGMADDLDELGTALVLLSVGAYLAPPAIRVVDGKIGYAAASFAARLACPLFMHYVGPTISIENRWPATAGDYASSVFPSPAIWVGAFTAQWI